MRTGGLSILSLVRYFGSGYHGYKEDVYKRKFCEEFDKAIMCILPTIVFVAFPIVDCPVILVLQQLQARRQCVYFQSGWFGWGSRDD